MAMQWQTVNVPLAAGLDTKGDVRASDPPKLDIARDVSFNETGGIQTRLPFGSTMSSIFGGGTISTARRVETVNGELVLFTSDSVYSWNAQQSAWVLRGTHLACKVTESPVFVTTGDQIDGDRAELNGTVVYVWTEGGQVFAAATDKTTGSVLVTPTAVSTAVGRPRLVALTTKILLFVDAGASNLTVRAIDSTAPGTAIAGAGASVIAGVFNSFYDVVKVEGQDLCVGACRRTVTTSYSTFTVTSALVVTAVIKARTADGPIAVASTPSTGLQTQVVRGNATNIQGDFLTTSTLADLTTGQAIGTGTGTINQIAACYRSVTTGGSFRCYAFWSSNENAGFATLFASKFNFVDTAGTIGTQANFVLGLGIASRAFSYNGSVYVWLAFGKTSVTQMSVALADTVQAQNAYVLYRDDAFLVAKAAYGVGAGFRPSTGFLPGVALTSGSTVFNWIGTYRRRLLLGGDSTAFAARASRDVTFTFDSNEARRCAVIGRTMYIAAGEVLQYDGSRVVECGFHFYPWTFDMLKSGTGSVPNGVLAYKITWRWANGQGEVERSTTATVGLATMAAGPAGFASAGGNPLTVSHKSGIAAEYWRTVVNGTADSPFFLASSPNPTDTAIAANQYVVNDPTVGFAPSSATWRDELADATLALKEANPENGTILESLCPPGASIMISTDTRIFLAGVAGDEDSIWYSRLRGVNEVVSFHDGNVVQVPRQVGAITAIAFNNETLTAFRSTAIYALTGQGFDNAGGGQNFASRVISLDVGAVGQESIALTPVGLIFKSRKGWYLLSASWSLQYIGGQVNAFDSDTVLAINVVETLHEVRILTSARMLVWDYFANQWGERTISNGLHATMWNGSYVYLTSAGPKVEQTSYSALTYGLDVETSWIKPELQGEFTLRWLSILGEYRSTHLLRIRVARDYQYDGAGNVSYFDDTAWTPSPTTVGSALQVKHTPSLTKMQAVKVRITAVTQATRATMTTASMSASIATSGTPWTATFNVWDVVFSGTVFNPGEMGNRVTMSIGFQTGTVLLVDIRDHYRYVPSESRWVESVNNIGVRVVTPVAGLTVNALEGAIALGTTLAQVQLVDPGATKTINITALTGQLVTGSFSGGTYTSPTGEALKLTGVALEIGQAVGINKRLPAAQKVS